MPKRLTDSELQEIQQAVTAAEARTTGEIVPVFVPASGRYAWVHPLLAFKGLILATIGVEIVIYIQGWPVSAMELLVSQILGAALGLGLSFVPAVKRWSVGDAQMAARVHERALAVFLEEGVTETKDRDGVLILVSLFEHRVEMLADRGIHEKVEKQTWLSVCEDLSSEIRAGRQVAGMKKAVSAVGKILAEKFPGGDRDQNELSDEPRRRE